MDTVDLWLTIVACLAAIETLYVCALATYRYSRRVYHLPLQRWTIRVLLVGPVYSVLMWVALWYPSLDFYLAVPLGFYECYAFFGFYAMLACFADGEDRLATALGSLNPGPPTAYLYHPFGFNWCSCRCDNYSPLFWGNVHYAALPLKFGSSRELLRFLKRGVAQAMIVKPCSLLLMLTLEYLGYEELCNATRLLSVVSFWCVANSITQLYHAVLPRIRGLGGERLVVLLLVMVSVLAIQDVVISVFLIQEEAITAPTDALPTRLVVILTILEFTAFSTIFYRLLPPEKFRTFARRSGASPEQAPTHQSMSLVKFVGVVLDPSTTVWKSKSELRQPERHQSRRRNRCNLASMALALPAIEQMQLRGRRRGDGLGRPKFDFHTVRRCSASTGGASSRPTRAPRRTRSTTWPTSASPRRSRTRAARSCPRSGKICSW